MQDQIEFIDGLFAKAPHPNAPDFIKANISIKREEMLNQLSISSRFMLMLALIKSGALGWGALANKPSMNSI